ncbi:MAG: histidine phosphatase family protein [Acidimicrobiales bacterium]
MTLIVVRHGRTAANASGRLLGRIDPPLDETGRAQAAALASSLARSNPGAVVISSPLARTRETADAIAVALGATASIDARWIELDYGELDGMPLADIPSEVWASWRADSGFAPPGGESLLALGERVRAACDEAAGVARAGDVVVVTHVSPVKAALLWALGVEDSVGWRAYVAPGSITRIDCRASGPVLLAFNTTPSTMPD